MYDISNECLDKVYSFITTIFLRRLSFLTEYGVCGRGMEIANENVR